jgi:endonuclease YncB( thermonuclease family)
MRESKLVYATRLSVAFALAASFLFVPPNRTVARTATSDPGTNEIVGAARVIDGDTVSVGDVRIRLEGIDAPESAQTCQRRWQGNWPCGSAATTALQNLIGHNAIRCERHGLDKYHRVLGVCFVDGRDVNAEMVRQGYAWAFVRYSTSYVKEEAAAKAERIGIWQGEAMPAWEYRHQHWSEAEAHAPQGCAIKGNVTRNGKIYHMPWSPWYAQIKMEPDKRKRWFCNEDEAVAAGWRPAQTN